MRGVFCGTELSVGLGSQWGTYFISSSMNYIYISQSWGTSVPSTRPPYPFVRVLENSESEVSVDLR